LGAGGGYDQCKEVDTLSLRLPMGLGVEHQVNFEVNLEDFGQSNFLEFWGFGRAEL